MEPARFDLAASLLRGERSDARTLVDALATKLSSALPEHTAVRHKGGALRARHRRIAHVDVRLGDDTFGLSVTGNSAQATRSKTVRGVVIRREELPLGQWLQALEQALSAEAQRSESARLALERLLG